MLIMFSIFLLLFLISPPHGSSLCCLCWDWKKKLRQQNLRYACNNTRPYFTFPMLLMWFCYSCSLEVFPILSLIAPLLSNYFTDILCLLVVQKISSIFILMIVQVFPFSACWSSSWSSRSSIAWHVIFWWRGLQKAVSWLKLCCGQLMTCLFLKA